MRRGRRKDLYRRERNYLEGPHEEAEIQRKALRRGKNLAFFEDACLEKERVRSKVTSRKVGVGLKRRQEPSKRLAWWGSTEREASYLFGLRGRHQYSEQCSNCSLCGLHRIRDRGGGGPKGQIVSVQLTEGGREHGRSLLKRKKSTGPRTDSCGTPRWT